MTSLVRTASAAIAPLGALSRLRLGNMPGADLTWGELDRAWGAETRPWGGLDTVTKPANMSFADVVIAGVPASVNFLEDAAWRGPAGFSDFIPMQAGDYEYQKGVLLVRLNSPGGVGNRLAIQAAQAFADVPDVVDYSRAPVTAPPGGIRINYQRTFYAVPNPVAIQVGGLSVATAKILSKDETGFTVAFFATDDPSQSVEAEFSWISQGY